MANHFDLFFNTQADGLLQSESGPFTWGLSPFVVIVIFLLIVLIIWLALRGQSERDDLHNTGHEGELGHEAEDHGGSHAAAEAEGEEEQAEEAPAEGSAEEAAPAEPDNLT